MRVLRSVLLCAAGALAVTAGCADDASYPAGAPPTQPTPGSSTGGTLPPRDGGVGDGGVGDGGMADGGTGTLPVDAGPLSGDGGGLGNDASPPPVSPDGALPGPDAG